MRGTALRPRSPLAGSGRKSRRAPQPIDLAWGAFAVANFVAMVEWERWETIPFHFIWVSLTLLYGFRVWRLGPTSAVLGTVVATTGVLITIDVSHDTQEWGELFEVPLMSAMFLAMVWHGRRRQQAMDAVEALAESRASLLERHERFLHDASHELRTPVTIAQGHLEVLRRERGASAELDVAVDELMRMNDIVDRLLLLAKADQPDFVLVTDVELEPFLENVFMRWSEVASRAWRLGPVAAGMLRADGGALRIALDALLENAVKYSAPGAAIEIRAHSSGGDIAIEVRDDGYGIPADALERIFDRFARADAARTRAEGGVGLGLAIVDAIAKAHAGRCTVRSDAAGTTFALRLPGWRPALPSAEAREDAEVAVHGPAKHPDLVA
jgi:signal transduction histidine kinase